MSERPIRSICVFCGSSVGKNDAYRQAATILADQLVARRLQLVYGGGNVGLMGVVADRVIARGGEAVGVIPKLLIDRELAHRGLARLVVTDDMTSRKAEMARLADAFVALPGGLGTLEEISEVMSWAQLQLHQKPFGFLNVHRYYSPFVEFLDHGVAEGFITRGSREMIVVEDEPAALLDRLVWPMTDA